MHQISSEHRDALAAAGLDPEGVRAVIAGALAEDLDGGVDITAAATIPPEHRCVVDLVVRAPGVLAGGAVAAAAFDIVGGSAVQATVQARDGARVAIGERVLTITGATREVLTAERTALNLLGHLSGVASATARWVEAVAGTRAQIRDTRKTMPGLRALEKYAVRCGGGVNHRMGLFDEALVKDNHIAAAGSAAAAFRAVRRAWPEAPVEVEVDDLEQLAEVLDAGATQVLLDNFPPPLLRRAVALNDGRATLEASGGLTLDTAAEVAGCGVDFIAVGGLTHSAPVLDIGADYREEA